MTPDLPSEWIGWVKENLERGVARNVLIEELQKNFPANNANYAALQIDAEYRGIDLAFIESTPRVTVYFANGGIGDGIASTCALPGLKAMGSNIIVVAHETNEFVYRDNPYVDKLQLVKHGEKEPLLELYKALNVHTIDLGCPLVDNGQRYIFPNTGALTLCEYICQIAGVPANDELILTLTDEHLEWGQTYENSILIHARTLWTAYKNWPDNRWQALAEELTAKTGYPVYELSSPFASTVPGIKTLTAPTLKHAAAAVKASKLLIGLDSAFNHISRALQKPSIMLWGPTHPYVYGYKQNINLVNGIAWDFNLQRNNGPFLECQPCYKGIGLNARFGVCPNTHAYPEYFLPKELHTEPVIHACMAANTVEAVMIEALKLLQDSPNIESTSIPITNKSPESVEKSENA